ncbi:hypothetical protein [Desertivirga xinjiangensis]|uniref:hypothetical protein n=1 Tax=Desertivirga xinjiangensis TaxID=539206 RepID=UPI00210F14D8|nr:hypothetical protein [Pedobacter xinjiangensis]
MSIIKFTGLFTVFTLLIGLVFYGIEISDVKDVVLIPKFWVVFGFLFFLTVIAYAVSWFGLKKGGESSAFVLMGAITIKLLLSMAFVLVYLLKISVKDTFFAIQFFSLYFLFTSFEVYALLCNLRHQNKT